MQPVGDKTVGNAADNSEATQVSKWQGHVIKLEIKDEMKSALQGSAIITGVATGILYYFGMIWLTALMTACTLFLIARSVKHQISNDDIPTAYSIYASDKTTQTNVDQHKIGPLKDNECVLNIKTSELTGRILELRRMDEYALLRVKLDEVNHRVMIYPCRPEVTEWKWKVTLDGEPIQITPKRVYCSISDYYKDTDKKKYVYAELAGATA